VDGTRGGNSQGIVCRHDHCGAGGPPRSAVR
jgi:hypothetical protein